jgi:hypothetical protein
VLLFTIRKPLPRDGGSDRRGRDRYELAGQGCIVSARDRDPFGASAAADLCAHAVLERCPDLCSAANAHQNGAAAARRHAQHMEHLPLLFSGNAVAWIPLRPSLREVPRSSRTAWVACSGSGVRRHVPAARCLGRGATAERSTGLMAHLTPGHDRGHPVLRDNRNGTTAATLVFSHRSRDRRGPVLSLCNQQCGQSAGAGLLPLPH